MMSMPSKDVHIEINKEQMLNCVVTLQRHIICFNPNTASNTKFHKTGVLTVHGGSVMSCLRVACNVEASSW